VSPDDATDLAVPRVSRRAVLGGIAMAPLAAVVARWAAVADASPAGAWRFFDAHQAAVVEAATARLVPGPRDDPGEAGHPGAREANVTRYLDTLLAIFLFPAPPVHAGGPWSTRAGGEADHMAEFLPLDDSQLAGWRQRVASLQTAYVTGITALDAASSTGDFTTASPVEQDRVLVGAVPFRSQLFTNTIEGMYSVPEYGGNANLAGWSDISWPGDSQPRGYSAEEVERSDGVDPVAVKDLSAAEQVLGQLPILAGRGVLRGRRSHGEPLR